MTTHRRRRCAHCQILYTYQSSGPGCNATLNDATWCPDCKREVVNALARIPVAVERVNVPATREEAGKALVALAKREEERAKKHAAGELVVRRVFAPLFAMDEGKVTATKRFDEITVDGISYMVGTWSDDREPPEVKKEMERDKRTGELRPWIEVRD